MGTIPTGWTAAVFARDKVEAMLSRTTGLPNIQVLLQQTDGSLYVFQSGSTFYFWNTANELGAQVTFPLNYNLILQQMGTDITKVLVSIMSTV